MVCLWFIIQQFTLQLRERQIILGFFFGLLIKQTKINEQSGLMSVNIINYDFEKCMVFNILI
jgi:hypothetical protein